MKTLTRTKSSLNNVQKLYTNVDGLYSKLDISVLKLENLYKARRQLAIFEEVLKYNELINGERNMGNVATYVTNIGKPFFVYYGHLLELGTYLFNCHLFLSVSLCSSANFDQLKPYEEKATSLFQNIEKQTENMLLQGLNSKSNTQVPRFNYFNYITVIMAFIFYVLY